MFYKKNNERNATKIEKMEQDGPISKRLKAKSRASKPKLIHKEPGMRMYLIHEKYMCNTNAYFIINFFRMFDNII